MFKSVTFLLTTILPSIYRFFIYSAALALLDFEVSPLGADVEVGLELGVGLSVHETTLEELLHEVHEDDGIDTFLLVLRLDSDEEHLEILLVLPIHRAEDVEPAKGEELAVAFFEGAGDGRHHDSEADDVSVLVLRAENMIASRGVQVQTRIVFVLLVRRFRFWA